MPVTEKPEFRKEIKINDLVNKLKAFEANNFSVCIKDISYAVEWSLSGENCFMLVPPIIQS